jgi:hypothetical protein
MEKAYKYQNGTIYVTLPKSCDREALKKVTEEFLKKVISEGNKNGHSNPPRNF